MGIEYRAEVIGSMLRPVYLKDARKRWEAGNLGTLDFKRVEDRAVDEMIALQEQMRRRRRDRRRDAAHAFHCAADRRDFGRQADSRIHARVAPAA